MRELRFHKPRGLYYSFINTLLAVIIAGILSTSYLLDWPGEVRAAQAQAAIAQEHHRLAEKWAQLEADARAMCGENAAWELLPNGQVQCYTKHGKKTKVRML